MKTFEGILICTDLDGTLLRKDKSVSRENLEAIEHFKAEGGYFTFITGRMPYFSVETYRKIRPNAPVGCVNGSGIYDYEAGRYVWSNTMSRRVLDLVEYVEQNVPGMGIQVNALENIWFWNNNERQENFRRVTGTENRVCHYREVDEPIGKIVFCDENERLVHAKALMEAHPLASEFDFVRSARDLCEIMPKGIDKGTVLPKLAEHLGVDMCRTIAVGDYNNDLGMIRAAGMGIAVANAVEEVKAIADHITVSNEEHAIAKIISDIENGVLKI